MCWSAGWSAGLLRTELAGRSAWCHHGLPVAEDFCLLGSVASCGAVTSFSALPGGPGERNSALTMGEVTRGVLLGTCSASISNGVFKASTEAVLEHCTQRIK